MTTLWGRGRAKSRLYVRQVADGALMLMRCCGYVRLEAAGTIRRNRYGMARVSRPCAIQPLFVSLQAARTHQRLQADLLGGQGLCSARALPACACVPCVDMGPTSMRAHAGGSPQ